MPDPIPGRATTKQIKLVVIQANLPSPTKKEVMK